jgi:hypothetical protein
MVLAAVDFPFPIFRTQRTISVTNIVFYKKKLTGCNLLLEFMEVIEFMETHEVTAWRLKWLFPLADPSFLEQVEHS